MPRTAPASGLACASPPTPPSRLTTGALPAATSIDAKYQLKSSTGFLIEGEYAVTPGWSLKGRYVYETFRDRDPDNGLLGNEKAKGDHIAIQSVWYLP